MSAEIVELGAHENMTPEEALRLTLREMPTEVVIIGADRNGDFIVRSSHLTRKDVLWYAEVLRNHVLKE